MISRHQSHPTQTDSRFNHPSNTIIHCLHCNNGLVQKSCMAYHIWISKIDQDKFVLI